MRQLNVDFFLIGTGLCPIITAKCLLETGATVALCNPGDVFFFEDLELPFDPLWISSDSPLPRPEQWKLNHTQQVLNVVSPPFPGPTDASIFRQRSRLWLNNWNAKTNQKLQETLFERAYLEASEQGFLPQWLEGISAISRVPGISKLHDDPQILNKVLALSIPGLVDIDVPAYRNEIWDFVRERLPEQNVIGNGSQFDLKPGRASFLSKGIRHQVKWAERCLFFESPAVLEWCNLNAPEVLPQDRSQSKSLLSIPKTSHWEEWTWISRDPVRKDVIAQMSPQFGQFGSLFLYTDQISVDHEGTADPTREAAKKYSRKEHRLKILRRVHRLHENAGPGFDYQNDLPRLDLAMKEFRHLFFDFLGWRTATLRSYRRRQIFFPDHSVDSKNPTLSAPASSTQWISPADGPIAVVVARAIKAAEEAVSRPHQLTKGLG